MFCIQCGAQIPETARFCSRCGAPQGVDMPSQDVDIRSSEVSTPSAPPGMRTLTWQTSIWATIVGIVLYVAVAIICYAFYTQFLILLLVLSAHSAFAIYYSTQIYPTYFTAVPRYLSSTTISFLNGFCGGIIFGCLWNYNLTRGQKGVSHIVLCVFDSIGLFAYIYVLMRNVI